MCSSKTMIGNSILQRRTFDKFLDFKASSEWTGDAGASKIRLNSN